MTVAAPPAPAGTGGRVFWQPRRWPFWAYLALVIVGTTLWMPFFRVTGFLPWWVTAACVLVSAVLGILLGSLIRWLDLYGGNQAALIVAAFVWGALAAPGYAGTANNGIGSLVWKVLGVAAMRWEAAVSGALSEEWLKTVGVTAVILIGREFVRRPSQGMVLGACCGLGFQLVEDVLYGVRGAIIDPARDTGGIIVVLARSILGLNSHWLYSAMAGLGVAYAVIRRDLPRTRRLLIAGLLVAVAWWMHFFSNSPLVDAQLPGAAAQLGTIIKLALNVLLGYLVYRLAMRSEWRYFAAAVGAEPERIITPAEIDAMRTHRTRRLARKSHRADQDAVRELQKTQVRLANDIGTDPGAAARARATIHELRGRLDQSGRC